jgi:hypothetical protein
MSGDSSWTMVARVAWRSHREPAGAGLRNALFARADARCRSCRGGLYPSVTGKTRAKSLWFNDLPKRHGRLGITFVETRPHESSNQRRSHQRRPGENGPQGVATTRRRRSPPHISRSRSRTNRLWTLFERWSGGCETGSGRDGTAADRRDRCQCHAADGPRATNDWKKNSRVRQDLRMRTRATSIGPRCGFVGDGRFRGWVVARRRAWIRRASRGDTHGRPWSPDVLCRSRERTGRCWCCHRRRPSGRL